MFRSEILRMRKALAFISLFPILMAAQPAITAVVNGASYSEVLAPGCWMVIYGTSLAASTHYRIRTRGGVGVISRKSKKFFGRFGDIMRMTGRETTKPSRS